MDRAAWEAPDPGELRVLGAQADWDALADEYGTLLADGWDPAQMVPFRKCLDVAREGGASSVVIETRYIDIDYRSEYSSHYSRGFRSPPSSAQRLHFFRAPLRVEQLANLPGDAGYLGYLIVRPVALGPVGRTMLVPPPGMDGVVRTAVTEMVTLFGQQLPVTAVPFMQQDAELDRCAHAAAWMCHYSAFRRDEVSRRPMASFSSMADPSLGIGRPVPSEGLTPRQLGELLRVFDLPCQFYDIENLPSVAPGPGVPADPQPKDDAQGRRLPAGLWDTRIISVCCRYLNSAVPVIVGTEDHVFVLCGYAREPRSGSPDWIRFVRHDDQRGPYLWVDDVFTDAVPDYCYAPWRFLMVPLPEKLWLPPERAEGAAASLFEGLARAAAPVVAGPGSLLDLIGRDELGLRTYARRANDFKVRAAGRIDPILLREYRLARFSRYVWVVELIDRSRRSAGMAECVLGEAIFDATSSGLRRPMPLAIHIPGVAVIYSSEGKARGPIRCNPDPYRTGGVGAA